MTAKHPNPRARLHDLLDTVFTRFGYVPTVLVNALNIAGGIVLALVGDISKPAGVHRAIIGGALLVLAGIITIAMEWWRRATDLAQKIEVAQFSVAVTDVLIPLTARVASLSLLPKAVCEKRLSGIITEGANALLLLFKDAERARAVVYQFDEEADVLRSTVHVGRSDEPSPFVLGDGDRGDAAYKMIEAGETLFSSNVETNPPATWRGSGKTYRTFISASIVTDDVGHGMLTIDSPQAGALTPADVKLVVLIATLLGAGISATNRSSAARKLPGTPKDR